MDRNKQTRPSLPNVQFPTNTADTINQNKVTRSKSEVANSSPPNKHPSGMQSGFKKPSSSLSIVACMPDRRISIADFTPTKSQDKPSSKEVPNASARSSRSSSSKSNRRRKSHLIYPGSEDKNTPRLFDFLAKVNVKHEIKKVGRWTSTAAGINYRLIERLGVAGIFSYLLYCINHVLRELEDIRMQLDEIEKDQSWLKWLIYKFIEKIGIFELFLVIIVVLFTRFCLKGLDILHQKLEMSQKLKEEELKNTLILKMKENKLKSKNEIWKTLTDGLTKIVSTIVSAVVPTAGVEHILMKVLDMAEKKQKDSSKYKAKEGKKASENSDDFSKNDQPKTPMTSKPTLLNREKSSRKCSASNLHTDNSQFTEKLGKNFNYLGGVGGPLPAGSPVSAMNPSKCLNGPNSQMHPNTAAHGNKYHLHGGIHKVTTDSPTLASKRSHFRMQKSFSGDLEGGRPVFKY